MDRHCRKKPVLRVEKILPLVEPLLENYAKGLRPGRMIQEHLWAVRPQRERTTLPYSKNLRPTKKIGRVLPLIRGTFLVHLTSAIVGILISGAGEGTEILIP